MMKKKNGFLLVELLIALAILTLSMVFFSHFFSFTMRQYMQAKERLLAMHIAQNAIEQLFKNQMPADQEGFKVTVKHLPLELSQQLAPMHVPQSLHVEFVEVTRTSGMPILLSGMIHEAT